MRINSIPPKDRYTQYVHTKGKVAGKKPASRSDSVEFTGEAKAFSAVLMEAKKAMEPSNIHTQRVAEIKQQIDEGTYDVPGILVAERILDR
ncbi:flagellar biosynthesis anti-sigma factor FlgM [Eubacteriales bacterium OttesenSCG-928-M02]|nr:flagellar biosynthesis anti-sigma factor FlgM [Eubacteriales bacterium OttesenSCG-928-M02]